MRMNRTNPMHNNVSKLTPGCVFGLVLGLLVAGKLATADSPIVEETPWAQFRLHSPGGPSGADGVKVADINGDGWMDVTTPFEQGRTVGIFLNPGPQHATEEWPVIYFPECVGAEDATWGDLDSDGRLDLVVSREPSGTVTLYFQPTSGDFTDPAQWQRRDFTTCGGLFAQVADIDGQGHLDIVAGGKGRPVVWMEAPANPREGTYKVHSLTAINWAMYLGPQDLDGDGDRDIFVCERANNKDSGSIFWLEHPGFGSLQNDSAWVKHLLWSGSGEPMMGAVADFDRDGQVELIATISHSSSPIKLPDDPIGRIHIYGRLGNNAYGLREDLPLPIGAPSPKAVALGDLDLDGHLEMVITKSLGNNPAHPATTRVLCLDKSNNEWTFTRLFGSGQKFDNLVILDLDGDHFPDILTCEENTIDGVFWLRNPGHAKPNTKITPVLSEQDDECRFGFSYLRPLGNVGGLLFTTETSSDLVNWTADTPSSSLTHEATIMDNGDGTETVTVQLDTALPPGNSLFMRLSIADR